MAGVEDVGALRGRGADLSLVSAPPGGAQLGAVLQGQAGVAVVHYHHGGPEGRNVMRNMPGEHSSVLVLQTEQYSGQMDVYCLLSRYLVLA